MSIQHFSELNAWKEGHQLVLSIYNVTDNLPKKESFGLISQLERAVVSITSNIAEGFTRKSDKEKLKFYNIALGSLMEVENQILICKDLKYLLLPDYNQILKQLVIVRKLLYGMRNYLLDSY